MNSFLAAFWTESLKVHKSKVPLFCLIGVALIPIFGGLFTMILKNPELAKSLGLISAKAQLMLGNADWPSYFGMLKQTIAITGIIVFSILSSWVFGREFSDKTAKELLALPTSRETIVTAKFAVIAVWVALATIFFMSFGLLVGFILQIPGFSIALAASNVQDILSCVISTTLLLPFIAWFASIGKGYLPPLGFLVLTIILSQVAVVLGWGDWFPWSIPILFSGEVGPKEVMLGTHSYVIILVFCFIGLYLTYRWWRKADQTR
jgi:ABC-2 type transport system permease protein